MMMDSYRPLTLKNGMVRSLDKLPDSRCILFNMAIDGSKTLNPITLINGSFFTFEDGWVIKDDRIYGKLKGPFFSLPRWTRLKAV